MKTAILELTAKSPRNGSFSKEVKPIKQDYGLNLANT